MDTLIVYCHPYEKSFCHAVLEALCRQLDAQQRDYQVDDLYADGFEPAMSAQELAAYNEGTTKDPLVSSYLDDLKACRHLVLVFPVWWNDAPAMLRGWLDRVLLKGATWDVTDEGMVGLLGDIEGVSLYTTSDNPTEFLENVTGNGIRQTLLDGTFMQLGIEKRIWHNFGCVGTATEAARTAWLHGVENDACPEVMASPSDEDEATVMPVFAPYALDEADIEDSPIRREYLYALIEIGQPISVNTLYRKYAQRFYTGRATSVVRREVDGNLELMKSNIVDCSLAGEDAAFTSVKANPIVPRLAGSRAVTEIPLVELTEDVAAVGRGTRGSLSRADFIRAVAGALGYKQAGRQIRECVGKAIDEAQKAGRLAPDKIVD